MGHKSSCGNQSPDPLIDFPEKGDTMAISWESVTRPLDRLPFDWDDDGERLGISHQTP